MDHRIWYDENDNIIHLEFGKYLMLDDMEPLLRKAVEITKDMKQRQVIINLERSKKIENRLVREQAAKIFQESSITHVAFVGGSAANRMIAKVLLKTGKKDIQGSFFKTEEEGINWIKNTR